uniref:Uncharacterized protein n=1 Tax=Anopheles maculatus TaxID=74869 RepID=A0A182SK33_9DIPT
MKQAVVFLLVVALAVMGSAKPYESHRKPSAPNQYPFYGPNFLYGSDRLSDEFLRRLFAQSVKDSAVDVPFVHLPDVSPSDADERLWQLLKPQEKPLEDEQPKPLEEDEIDAAEDREPLNDVPKEALVDREEKENNEKPIEKEQEKPQKPDQQPNEGDKEKEVQQQKPDQLPNEEDKEHKQQKPDQPPKEEDKKHKQQKPVQPPKEDEKDKEHKQQKPGQPPKEHDKRKGNRPGGLKPEVPSRPQPELPTRRQPELPLVQINVNVGSPVL